LVEGVGWEGWEETTTAFSDVLPFKYFKLTFHSEYWHSFLSFFHPFLIPLRNKITAARPWNYIPHTHAIKVNIKRHYKHKPYSPSLAKISAISLFSEIWQTQLNAKAPG
jgi:hypothetical protein